MEPKKALLIFDHDGTLNDSMVIFGPAMRKGIEWLHENGYEQVPFYPDEKIEKCLGLNSNDIWRMLVEDLSDETMKKVTAIVGQEMERLMGEGYARWFPEVYPMLDALKEQGYHMVILSNCQKKMAADYWEHFKMDRWFERFYECESYDFLPKTEIIKYIRKDYEGMRAIMIGDRSSDFACAKAVNIPFIGCGYGFAFEGELDGADAIAERPMEIVKIVRSLI